MDSEETCNCPMAPELIVGSVPTDCIAFLPTHHKHAPALPAPVNNSFMLLLFMTSPQVFFLILLFNIEELKPLLLQKASKRFDILQFCKVHQSAGLMWWKRVISHQSFCWDPPTWYSFCIKSGNKNLHTKIWRRFSKHRLLRNITFMSSVGAGS